MNERMPGISPASGAAAAMTSSTDIVRSDRGFSSTNIRPVFDPPVALLPVNPTLTPALEMFGSFRMMSATLNWRSTMSSKLMPCAASVLTLNRP